MSVRRFRVAVDGERCEGVEFADGRVVVNGELSLSFEDANHAARVLGWLEWIDPPRPAFSPLAVASIVLPEILGDQQEFIGLISWVTRVQVPFWTPQLTIGLCRVIRPHLERACPWLPEAVARWTPSRQLVDPERARDRFERWLQAEHPGPWVVEPLSPREFQGRIRALRVATARPWPLIAPAGPLRVA